MIQVDSAGVVLMSERPDAETLETEPVSVAALHALEHQLKTDNVTATTPHRNFTKS